MIAVQAVNGILCVVTYTWADMNMESCKQSLISPSKHNVINEWISDWLRWFINLVWFTILERYYNQMNVSVLFIEEMNDSLYYASSFLVFIIILLSHVWRVLLHCRHPSISLQGYSSTSRYLVLCLLKQLLKHFSVRLRLEVTEKPLLHHYRQKATDIHR